MRTWEVRQMLFTRLKQASSKFRAKKRERLKSLWWAWADRQTWVK